MGKEEQQEEREVLDSIFPDEIQDVNEQEYRITISLDVTIPSDEGEEPETPIIILNVQYPEAYPDEAPRLDITQPPNAPKHPHLNIQDDKARLLDALQPSIEENLGIAMIFTLVSTLKDAAELLISERQQAIQAIQDHEAAKAEEEENRKFEGEKVTVETFLKWREGFRREIEEAKEKARLEAEEAERKKKGPKADKERQLSGKQLWEMGIAGKNADEEDEGDTMDLEKMRELKVEG
ncbi:hypothetical protein MBLNU230_g6598t1 [Neophaeotheca triangularis]